MNQIYSSATPNLIAPIITNGPTVQTAQDYYGNNISLTTTDKKYYKVVLAGVYENSSPTVTFSLNITITGLGITANAPFVLPNSSSAFAIALDLIRIDGDAFIPTHTASEGFMSFGTAYFGGFSPSSLYGTAGGSSLTMTAQSQASMGTPDGLITVVFNSFELIEAD